MNFVEHSVTLRLTELASVRSIKVRNQLTTFLYVRDSLRVDRKQAILLVEIVRDSRARFIPVHDRHVDVE